jgi:phosphoribosylformylglycinamidine synthase
VNDKMTMDFKTAGDVIYLVGKSRNDINSSEYLHKIHGVMHSPAPHFDLEDEFALQQIVSKLISSKLVNAAHDVSEGGLFVTLMESAFNRNTGFDITSNAALRKDAFLFGEAQSRVVVTVAADGTAAFEQMLSAAGSVFEKLGMVTTGAITIDGENWGSSTNWKEKYDNAIGALLAGHESEAALSVI